MVKRELIVFSNHEGGISTMGKRGNGEGSIYRRNDGKWTGSITLGNNKRKVFYGKTRKEVQEKLLTVLHEQQQGTLIADERQTVAQFLTDWLEKTHKPHVRARTYERYRDAVYLHIIPVLGRHQLSKLSAQHVQAFYTQKLEEGLAAATIMYYHSVLHNALDTAVKWGLVARNVCNLVTPPRQERYEIQPLTLEQVQKLLVAVHGHKWEALYTLALATGMRRGELLGLKWQDINMQTGTLQVRRILTRVPAPTEEKRHIYIEAEPKTQHSRRSVIIASFALEMLKQHLQQQIAIKARSAEVWQEHDYVFCTSLGTHLNPNHVVDELKKLLKKAELPNIRFHDLRHSAATMLLSIGVHPKVVQELLGHTQISMTMDIYSHVLPGMQRDAMSRLHDALKMPNSDAENQHR
jgi:integrase